MDDKTFTLNSSGQYVWPPTATTDFDEFHKTCPPTAAKDFHGFRKKHYGTQYLKVKEHKNFCWYDPPDNRPSKKRRRARKLQRLARRVTRQNR